MNTLTPKVGDFLTTTLVTDTIGFEVVKTTPKTITVRPTKSGRLIRNDSNGSPFPISYTEMLPDPGTGTKVLRLRKDGSYRMARWASPMRPAYTIDGVPVTKVDYSF